MEVIKSQSLLIVNSNENSDMFNIICCRGNVTRDDVKKSISKFKDNHLQFAWWTGFEGEPQDLTEYLVEYGLRKSEEELAMVRELASAPSLDISPAITIMRVTNSKIMQDFLSIIIEIVPHESKAITRFFQQAGPIICDAKAGIEYYVGYLGVKPISTCSVFFSEDIAGIFDIIALPESRGKGIGSAMTIAAINAAKNRGYNTCVLTATNDAKYLYEKLGFIAVKQMAVYA
jgi:ribosomal protein S18 acetylase RimI-like enzyme